MPRAAGLTSAELETRERVFDALVTRAVRHSLRAITHTSVMTAAVTLSAEPAPPNPTIPAGALGVVTTTWTQQVDDVLFPYVVQTFVDAAEQVYADLPDAADVPKITYDLAASYLASAANRLSGIGDVVWNDMKTQLALGYEAGESVTELAARLRHVVKISEPRARTIARTEIVPAANFGSLQQLKVVGFTDAECQKMWLATDDTRTREAHRLADGQTVGLNQPFHVDGDFLQVPGDPAGRAENVINCRCTLTYVFADDDDEEDDDADRLLTADALFEKLHPRDDHGRFGNKSPFNILPKELRGKSGDGMYAPGMWGKYGAAGVMMRHVDERGTPRYLLVQRASPGKQQWKWQLPGGALEEKETPAQGAAREAFEEIGLTEAQLATLTPRGEHAIDRSVADKPDWRYTNVVADAPERFTPRVDRKKGELWKAVWLTEEQIREMMTRDRLVAPLAAEIDSILAKYDEPLVAGFYVITMTSGSPDVTDGDYYDLVTASSGEWTAADEAKVKRDSEGKFAKKAGAKLFPDTKAGFTKWLSGLAQKDYDALTPAQKDEILKKANEYGDADATSKTGKLIVGISDKNLTPTLPKKALATAAPQPIHINTKVIYTTKYADGAVVAEKSDLRLVWSEQLKKFNLQQKTPSGNWGPALGKHLFTKKDAYNKFSKETGWFTPSTSLKSVAAQHLTAPVKKSPAPAPAPAPKLNVPPSVSASPVAFDYDDTSGPGGSMPVKYNGVDVLYAESDTYETHLFVANDDGTKGKYVGMVDYEIDKDDFDKFVIDLISSGVVNVSTLAPSTTPAATPAPLGKPIHLNTVAIYKTKYADGAVVAEKTDASGEQRLVWDAKKKKFILQKIDGAMWVPQQEFNKGEAYKKFSKQTGWTYPTGSDAAPAPLSTPAEVKIPDFYSDPPHKIAAFYASLTQDDFDKLSASDQALIVNEAPFYDVNAPLGQKFSDKIKGFMAGTGDSDTVAQKFAQDVKDVNHLISPAAFNDWFFLHVDGQGVTAADWDQLDASEKKKLKTLAATAAALGYDGPHDKISVWEGSGGAETRATVNVNQTGVSYDWDDNSGPGGMTPVKYNGTVVAYAKSAPDGSGAFLYAVGPNGEKLGSVGNVDFGDNETVEQVIANLLSDGKLSTTPASPATTPAVVPVAAPVAAPTGSSWYVDVHNKIKPISQISTPASPAPPPGQYKVITSDKAAAMQQHMLSAAGKTWTKAEIDAAKRYTTSVGYRTANAVLRDDEKQQKLFSDAQLKDGIKNAVNLQNAMTPLTDNVRLHRNVGTGSGTFGVNFLTTDISELKKKFQGKVITDRGFTSTTVQEQTGVSYDYATKPVFMIFNAPAGTPAIYADSAVPGHSEQEFILAAGTSYHIDEIRIATAADKAKYGNHVQHIIVSTVVPSTHASSTPLAAPPAKPAPAVTPTPLVPAAPSAAVAPTLGPITPADLKKPMKITTKVIHTTKYQHGAVVAYRKVNLNGNDSLLRLAWSDTTKKFILQRLESDGTWTNFTGHSKKDAYASFAKQSDWYEPPAGDSAIGSGGVFGTTTVAPKISTSAPLATGTPTAKATPPKPQPKLDAATLQAQHGQIPAGVSDTIQRAIFNDFKKNSGAGFITLSSSPETVFTALKDTLDKHNETYKTLPDGQLNLLQLLRIIDQQSTNKANAVAKKADPNAAEITNTQAYEKKVVDWLQTPAGATFATNLVHPQPIGDPDLNTTVYKSNFSAAALATLAKIKPASSIGTPDNSATVFETLTPSQARKMQDEMLATNPWTSSQQAALKKYTGSYYTTFNPIIRDIVDQVKYTSSSTQETAARDAVNIQGGMRPLPKSVRVFRKTKPSQFPGLTDFSKFSDIKKFEGKLFTDRAPLSTSINSGMWSGSVHMTIDVPAGTPAAYVEQISQNSSETEMILALGLKYRVVSVTGNSSVINVHLRVEA